MRKITSCALALCLSVCAGPQIGAAELAAPDVKVMMGRVEAILVASGYDARGYAATNAPRVDFVDDLPGRRWGAYIPGEITLSSSQPRDCIAITLAHELAHDAAVKLDLIAIGSQESAEAIKTEMEHIASKVERHVASDGVWLPGCMLRRGVE